MGYSLADTVITLSDLLNPARASVAFRLTGCGAFLVPFSPLLFCWWVELADRSSGTAMGSSVSSDVSLAGGLSRTADTHQQTPISHHATPSLPDRSHSGEAKLPPASVRAGLWPYCIYLLHSIRFNHAVGSVLPGIWDISWASSVSMRCKYSNGREMEM